MSDDVLPQLEQIKTWLADHSEPAFRYTQVEQAWYAKPSWDAVTTLNATLRNKLAKKFSWSSVKQEALLTSKRDGTQKAVVSLVDGARIETVLMPNARGQYTACVSSQVGCGMGCTFCATGTMGLKRNLTADEIIDQLRYWNDTLPDCEISNVVFMGMGEPLANYQAVKQALHAYIDKLGIAPTHITVSTVGVPAILHKLLTDEDFPPVRVAFSLHAGTDETRQSIVPSHKRITMQGIFDWATAYAATLGNRRHHVTFEYVMLSGVNDMPSEAQALVKRFAPLKHRVKFNLIPWNPIGKQLEPSSANALETFRSVLEKGGLTTTIRYSKGLDIAAACGQLVTAIKK